MRALLLTAGVGYLVHRARQRAGNGAWRASRRTLADVMTRDVEVVRPESPIREAATRMAALDVGTIPVCDGERLLGLVTDRDIVIRAVARGADPATTPVRDVMTSSVSWCYADEPVSRGIQAMKSLKIRRLPIVDRQKRLVGIVSLGDLAADRDILKKASEVLHRVSEPAEPRR
jgi:CBS domain-containing protein